MAFTADTAFHTGFLFLTLVWLGGISAFWFCFGSLGSHGFDL
jgi:hypothetical protein